MKQWDVEINKTVRDSLHVTIEAETAEDAEEKARDCNERGDFDQQWQDGYPDERCEYYAQEY